jgi:hypothetical protein
MRHTVLILMKRNPGVRATGLLGVLGMLSLPALAAAHGRHVAQGASISTVHVSGATLTVRGSVRLAHAGAAKLRGVRVLLTLTDAAGHHEQRAGGITASRRFAVRWTTRLTGQLTLRALALVSGRPVGAPATRVLRVAPPIVHGSSQAVGTRLVGTFKLDPGSAPAAGSPTGSYFEMIEPNGQPLSNPSSSAGDQHYTPLAPGSDGGLRTDGYQPAPSPAFAGGSSGNSLAGRIIKPTPFYLIDFGIETSPTDAQTGQSDPVPVIAVQNGKLTGQVTAWVAQWNGQSFNQGSPKPDGTLPAPTTALTGTYDATSHAFTLTWRSLIVGGPFNGFTGVWHLAGTFAPDKTSVLPVCVPTAVTPC